ncbi:MAG: cytochrome c-type biogenesis protein [Gemmatimonadaceae bacterium]
MSSLPPTLSFAPALSFPRKRESVFRWAESQRGIARRELLRGAAAAIGLAAFAGRDAAAQSAAQGSSAPQTNFGPMDEGAYRAVRLPPKPGAAALLNDEERDALEHGIRCQCGCSLDVYTCRTTDFTCPVSPAMHRDVLSLVEGGHSADEIIAAFEGTYGEQVRMSPRPEGFNLLGYFAPFAALGAGAVTLFLLIRRWSARSEAVAAAEPPGVDATAEELDRIDAAVRSGRS